MKKMPFAIASLIAGIMVFIPALLILIADVLKLPESHPFVAIAFPLVLIFSLPEAPVMAFESSPGIPMIVPAIGIICGGISLWRKEKSAAFAVAGISLVIISLLIHLGIQVTA